MALACPHCGIVRPDSQTSCDCGHREKALDTPAAFPVCSGVAGIAVLCVVLGVLWLYTAVCVSFGRTSPAARTGMETAVDTLPAWLSSILSEGWFPSTLMAWSLSFASDTAAAWMTICGLGTLLTAAGLWEMRSWARTTVLAACDVHLTSVGLAFVISRSYSTSGVLSVGIWSLIVLYLIQPHVQQAFHGTKRFLPLWLVIMIPLTVMAAAAFWLVDTIRRVPFG